MGKYRYGVILDAGSSGTRVYVYRWLKPKKAVEQANDKELARLPELSTKKKWTLKIKPGLSTFGEKPEMVGHDHLKELMDHALSIVPEDDVEDTPIFLLATAGMRLLPNHQRDAVLDNVCSYLRRYTKFQLPDCDLHIQVIPGTTEGLYGWIAANYLLGGFDPARTADHGDGHQTYGFLDMGGASAQIAFAPNSSVAATHGNDLTLLRLRAVGGEALEYRVFVTTWLGYGVNEARKRFIEAMVEASPNSLEYPDPCMPAGLIETADGKVIPVDSGSGLDSAHLLGTGKFKECLAQTFPLLQKDAPCDDAPCLFNGIHVPPVDFKVNHFVGVSEYWHTTHSVFEGKDEEVAYDFLTYQKKVDEFCSQDWKTIQAGVGSGKWGNKVDETTAAEACFKSSWLINVLHDGIGIPRTGMEIPADSDVPMSDKSKQALKDAKDRGLLDSFHAVDKIDGTELSWTLGKMVLYASSQHEPADGAMAVGFGSNIPGSALPKDFQFPSVPSKSNSNLDPSEDLDWHDKLLTSASARRVPGLLLFVIILGVIGILLCGRERRKSILAKLGLGRGSPSPSWSGAKKRHWFFGRFWPRGQKYNRVGADGPEDFELGPAGEDSDSDVELASSVKGTRASGWTTPGLAVNNPAPQGPLPSLLTTRTESRERLAPTSNTTQPSASGSRSRQTSPTRRSSPLTTFKASID